MSSSLSNLVSNLSEGIHKSDVNTARTIKNGKHVKLNINIVTVFLNTQVVIKVINKN